MTQKEIIIINAINRAGLDNSMWGIETCKHSNDTRHMYGTEEHIKVKPHIYTYLVDNKKVTVPANLAAPDVMLTDANGQRLFLYNIELEGGAR